MSVLNDLFKTEILLPNSTKVQLQLVDGEIVGEY